MTCPNRACRRTDEHDAKGCVTGPDLTTVQSWLEWQADDDCIRVGLHVDEGWYFVTGRDRPMVLEHGNDRTLPRTLVDMLGGIAARHLAEAYAP